METEELRDMSELSSKMISWSSSLLLWMVSTLLLEMVVLLAPARGALPSLCSSSWLLFSITTSVSSYRAWLLSIELGPDIELDPAEVELLPSELADLHPGDDLVRGEDLSEERGVAAK